MATNRGEGRPTTADPSPAAAAAVIENSTAAATSRGENGAGPQPLEVRQPATIRVAAPSFGGVVRTVMIVVACAIGLYLLWRIRGVVRLVGISLFLALALMPIVDALDNRIRVPRAVLILGVYVLLIATVIVIGYVVVPSLVKEVGQLSHDGPRYAAELRHNGTFRHYDDRYHITPTLVRDARRLPHLLGHLVGPLKNVTIQAFAFIGQLLTVLAITFLLVLHGRQYVKLGLSLTGDRSAHYRQLIIDINQAVAQYVLGNITISVLATIATWIVLSILGVPYASRWASSSDSST
jgi:predicted PurR-regulated permease PerM